MEDYDDKATDSQNGYNWGAFWLTGIWGACHGYWLSLAYIPLILVALFLSIFSIVNVAAHLSRSSLALAYPLILLSVVVDILTVITLYRFGRKGNKLAWIMRGSRDKESYKKREKNWAIAGWVVGVIAAVWYVSVIYVSVANEYSSPDCGDVMSIECFQISK
ncbi:MAG: hypothetical protein WC773_04075 [Patescibacteria group bacterium]|jgi:hypothetical protein